MIDLISEASTLSALLEETRGVIGVVLGTSDGELRTVVGSFTDSNATAVTAASLTGQLSTAGALLGLGDLSVASLKSPTSARVFAHQSGAVLAIELDAKRPLGELEGKLRTLSWAPGEPIAQRAPTVPRPLGLDPAGAQVAARGSAPGPMPVDPSSLDRSFDPMGGEPPTSPSIPRMSGGGRLPPSVPVPPPLAHSGQAPGQTKPPPLPPPRSRSPSMHTRPQTPAPMLRARSPSSSTPVPLVAKAPGSGPVFTGDLEQLGLPDLLEFLRTSNRTGLLVCETFHGTGSVQLSRGMIVAAESPHAVDLREFLLTNSAIEIERRHAIAALPLDLFETDALDGVLASRNLVSRDELERARIARIYSAFREMLRWTVGRFSFDPGFAVIVNPALALSAHSILMDIYQEQDEQAR